jgi:hypothetical protein
VSCIANAKPCQPEHKLTVVPAGGKGGGTSGGGRTSSSSNTGGATRSGSGPTRAYGGGGFYGGGASTPYSAGSKTPKGLVAGALILPGAAALFIFPGLWLYSVYPYYLNQYRFYNQSFQNATAQGLNQTLNVTCLCQQYQVCGCDNNDNQQYLHDLVGNGSYDALNRTLVNVADVNGTRVLALNGSLPNGTTAPGGTDDAAAGLRVGKYSGYFVMVMIVLSTIAFC